MRLARFVTPCSKAEDSDRGGNGNASDIPATDIPATSNMLPRLKITPAKNAYKMLCLPARIRSSLNKNPSKPSEPKVSAARIATIGTAIAKSQ